LLTPGCSNKAPTLNSQLGEAYTPKITKPLDDTRISVYNIQELNGEKKQDENFSKPQKNFSLY